MIRRERERMARWRCLLKGILVARLGSPLLSQSVPAFLASFYVVSCALAELVRVFLI